MKKVSKFLKSAALLTLLLPLFLLAEESHFPVGSEADPAEENLLLDFDSEEASEIRSVVQNGSFFNGNIPVCYPASDHWIRNINGTLIEIEDGSGFETDWHEARKASLWNHGNAIIITQNDAWFSKYSYRMIERNNGQSIPMNLVQGPAKDNPYLVQIATMDAKNGVLFLTNNLRLMICPQDRHTFSHWHEGQPIIIGLNSGWQTNYSYILINVSKNNFVRAKG